jgi:signal transduction histidine kinase
MFVVALMEDFTEQKLAQDTIERLNMELERRVVERSRQLAVANQELAQEVPRRRRAESERERLLAEEQAARREAEAGRQRLAFLAEASRVLASSLDYETTLQRVAHLAVPTMADWCFVDVADPDGSVRRLAVAQADPTKASWARELLASPPARVGARAGPAMVIRTGQPELLSDVAGRLELLLPSMAESPGPALREILRRIDPRSWMVVPLTARARTIGAITFVSAESGRRYGPDDLVFADDLARRAALAVDNARLYQEAQEALAAREEFLSIAAHELKTPITSLRLAVEGFLRYAASGLPADSRQIRHAFRTADEQSVKLARMVVQLLEISRLQLQRFVLDRSETDVASLVRAAADQAQARTSRHSLVVSAPAELWAFVDAIRVEQVITNLLDNAIKYSPDGGQIDVTLGRSASDRIFLTVRDRGIGIPPDRRGRIFELFYQAHAESHQSGMGIGLYITRQIVEAHGGRIGVEFPADGGSSFQVELPVRPIASPGEPTGRAMSHAEDVTGS